MAKPPSDIPHSKPPYSHSGTPESTDEIFSPLRANTALGIETVGTSMANGSVVKLYPKWHPKHMWSLFLGDTHFRPTAKVNASGNIDAGNIGIGVDKDSSRTKRHRVMPYLKGGVKAGILGIYFFGMGVFSLCLWAVQDLPSVDQVWDKSRPNSIRVLDRYGREMMVRGAKETLPVNVQTLPPHVYLAVLAVEDKRFFEHIGVDPLGLLRAGYVNIKAGKNRQGGSTLTQQLAKNALLTSDRTIKRKIQEAILALNLERSYSKADILELYLNKVFFGGTAYGIDAGARQYFNKPASEITLTEAAMLAGLLKAPSTHNPNAKPEKAAKRTGLVLRRMIQAGFIDEETRQASLQDPLYIHNPSTSSSVNYFIDWIWPEVKRKTGEINSDITIETTLDLSAQAWADEAVKTNLNPSKGADEVALVAVDGTGQVRAMIGGSDFAYKKFNRATSARRQPGSAFKPFVFLAALKAGVEPWDYRLDAPVTIGDWEPRNFKETYKGEVTLLDALAKSINTVSVVLSEEVGRDQVVNTAADFGLTGLKPLRSIALGAQEVSPLELTQAYVPFANSGYAREAYGITAIYGENKRVIYRRSDEVKINDYPRVMDIKLLGQMNMLMQGVVNGGTGRRAAIEGRDIGGKTGTTNDFRDAWFVGYVPQYVTGVWVGADDNSPMKDVSGGTIPAQIWHDFMVNVLEGHPYEPLPTAFLPSKLPVPRGLTVDSKTGVVTYLETMAPLAPKPESVTLNNLLDKAQTLLTKSP